MGLVAIDQQPDTHLASGSYGKYVCPPAIYSEPPKDFRPYATIEKFALYQGSGGEVASLLPVSPSGSNTQVELNQPNNLSSAVSEICMAFELTKEELAEALKIQSRKTLYNWINGETIPRKAAMNRVFDLLVVAKAWRGSGLGFNREQLHEPVLNGKSVFDLLNQPKIEKELILFAGSRLNMTTPTTRKLSDPFA